MKAGVRPIILESAFVPEYPTYWVVSESASAGVELLVADGQLEYEPSFARGAGGQFVPEPALALQLAQSPRPFARKGQR
ncbi:MAG: hypothetical protein V4593_08240 [Pseudomonadota bacterium]